MSRDCALIVQPKTATLPASDVAYIAVAAGIVNAIISQLRPFVGAKLAAIRSSR